ncbi:MAG: Lsr2 family protein, partial [Actinobacteria bacterium]|nr:Lsr2 family protein [Actinomycetota bacterium]
DGKSYEIDLSKKNAAALEKARAPYLAAGRCLRGQRRGVHGSGSRGARSSATAEIREWAQASGYEVGAKGRIPAAIVEAFEAEK